MAGELTWTSKDPADGVTAIASFDTETVAGREVIRVTTSHELVEDDARHHVLVRGRDVSLCVRDDIGIICPHRLPVSYASEAALFDASPEELEEFMLTHDHESPYAWAYERRIDVRPDGTAALYTVRTKDGDTWTDVEDDVPSVYQLW